MSEIYADVVRLAHPVALPDSDAGTRVAEEITSAQAVVGPGVFPLGAIPADFPLPNPAYWTEFSYMPPPPPPTPTPSGGTTPTPTRAPTPASSRIWTLRTLEDGAVLQSGVGRAPPMAADITPAASETPAVASSPARTIEESPVARRVASGSALESVAGADVAASTPAPTPVPTPTPAPAVALSLRARRMPELPPYLKVIDVPQSPQPPPVQQPVTNLSLQHMLVMIDRSPWWHNDLVIDTGWCVPGMAKGAWVAAPPSANQADALPIALLLVQNLQLSGSWSSDDTAALTAPGRMLGPFNLGGAAIATGGDGTVTISVPGMFLVGLFCQRLPVLPPNDGTVATGSGGDTAVTPAPTPTPQSTRPPPTPPPTTAPVTTPAPTTAPATAASSTTPTPTPQGGGSSG
jgi:hypothetical protein